MSPSGEYFPNISILGQEHTPIWLDSLRPGDIGFEYKKVGKDFRQKLISSGERVVNAGRQKYRGDSDTLHAFVVLEAKVEEKSVMVSDAAAGDDDVGICNLAMPFTKEQKYTDKDAKHVFYRFKDPLLAEEIVRLAHHWGDVRAGNFSMSHALSAPFLLKGLHTRSRRRLLYLSKALQKTAPVPGLRGRGYYRVMCSEYVASVCAAAAMGLYSKSQRLPLEHPANLQALKHGPAGDIFNCDPRQMVPSALHGRMLRCTDSVEVVGYVPPIATMVL